jgi:hypothetical protein
LATYEGNSGKNGAMKRIYPRRIETRKGGSGKNGFEKWKMQE